MSSKSLSSAKAGRYSNGFEKICKVSALLGIVLFKRNGLVSYLNVVTNSK